MVGSGGSRRRGGAWRLHPRSPPELPAKRDHKEGDGRQGDIEAESVYTSIKPTDSSAASQAGIHSGSAVVEVRWKRGDETSVSICSALTRPDGIGE